MNLLIVERYPDRTTFINPHYRGTARSEPLNCYALPPNTEINQLGRWYMDAIVKEPLHDLDRSRRFVDLLHQFDSSKQFELIEVVEMGLKPGVGTVFLGFDVIEGYGNSLLQYGLKSFASNRVIAESIKHLADLINYTFAPLLNAQGLFQEHELASYCRRSKVALQNLHPCFYGSSAFSVE